MRATVAIAFNNNNQPERKREGGRKGERGREKEGKLCVQNRMMLHSEWRSKQQEGQKSQEWPGESRSDLAGLN